MPMLCARAGTNRCWSLELNRPVLAVPEFQEPNPVDCAGQPDTDVVAAGAGNLIRAAAARSPGCPPALLNWKS